MVPDEGVTVIQGAFSVAVHVLSLERLDERTTVCGDGSMLPLVAEKVRALGLTCKAHDGFTKPRSIAIVNAVPPSIFDIVCRIGAVRRSWIIIQVVLNDMNPFRCILFTGEGAPALVGKAESNACAVTIFFGRASKHLAGTG
jgi:hypothetical protein